ncbi:MAG: ShlB/FhaC/HecB family hemolysin secretion/activation protein [Planctomycetaceae bacterium]
MRFRRWSGAIRLCLSGPDGWVVAPKTHYDTPVHRDRDNRTADELGVENVLACGLVEEASHSNQGWGPTMGQLIGSRFTAPVAFAIAILCSHVTHAQNYERYKPLDIPQPSRQTPQLPEAAKLPDAVEDDRELVVSLDAVVIVDHADKVVTDASIDDLQGIHYNAVHTDSLFFKDAIRSIIQRELGKPVTLRRINGLSRDIIRQYRSNKQPIVDVVIPEQRITTGTLHLVITESRIGDVLISPGRFFSIEETQRWIESTRIGDRIYEPNIEDDLFWMNRNSFAQVGVNFEKGRQPGTTNVIYKVKDRLPIRAYVGVDDSGVESLNYGRVFTGFQYGNFLGWGGTLGYQYTADEDFNLLEAHSVNFTQAIDRDYSFMAYGSWAGVSPMLDAGLSQQGESYQHGMLFTRNIAQTRDYSEELTFGYDFKSTNNNLEFAGTTISASTADLVQFRVGYRDMYRYGPDQFSTLSIDTFVGPGGGFTGDHSRAAFESIRPGASPDYIYARLRYQTQRLIEQNGLLSFTFTGQVASERLLFSETLGLGGFDTIRGTDQREFNADNGWIANIELGPRTYRWGPELSPRSLRFYGFLDVGNGYVYDRRTGEDGSTLVASTGFGARLQISDRITARIDYGLGVAPINDDIRSDRLHFGVTWIPGLSKPRPRSERVRSGRRSKRRYRNRI